MPQNTSSSKSLFTNLLKGTSFNLVAKVLAVALGFIASLLISRHYGADGLGIIATITSFFTLAATVALLGTDTLVLKVIPQVVKSSGSNGAKKYYIRILAVILASCTVVVITLLSFNFLSSSLDHVSPILPYALIFVAACLTFNAAMLRSLGDYVLFSLLDFLPPLFMLLVVAASLQLNLTESTFTHFYFTGIALVCTMSFVLLRVQLSKTKNSVQNTTYSTAPNIVNTLKTSIPMLGVTLSVMAIQHTDILLIGYFIDQSTVGVYSIYTKLTSLVLFATISINSMFSPTVSMLFSEERHKELKQYAKKTTALLSLFSIGIAAVLLVGNGFVLNLYGKEFLVDRSCFYILLLAPVIHSCFGSTGFFLNMTGGQNTFFVIMASAAILNLIGNLALIPRFGIHGAAIASVISIFAWNCAAMIIIKKRYGYTLFFTGNKS